MVKGRETTFAQIAADELGINIEDVEVLHGDTDMLPHGQGTFASRGLSVGGSAVHAALQEARQKLAVIAAHILECPPEDVAFRGGTVFNKQDPEGRRCPSTSWHRPLSGPSLYPRERNPGWSSRLNSPCPIILSDSAPTLRWWKWTRKRRVEASCAMPRSTTAERLSTRLCLKDRYTARWSKDLGRH